MAFACLHVRPPAMDHGLLGTCYKASHSGVPSISFFCVNGELTVYAFLLVTTRLRHMWRRVLLQQVCLQQRMARSRRRQRLRAAFQLGQFPWASTLVLISTRRTQQGVTDRESLVCRIPSQQSKVDLVRRDL